jgi:acyl-CoA synthetase (AMP-forming)/AMP-acid ligase II
MAEGANLWTLLEGHTQARAHAVAFEFLGRRGEVSARLSYAELRARAAAIGASLQAQGLGGRPIGLLMGTSPEFVASLLAVVGCGGVAIPLGEPRAAAGPARLEAILRSARPAALIAEASVASRFEVRDVPVLSAAELDDDGGRFAPASLQTDDVAILQYTSGSTSEPKGVRVSHANFLHNARYIARVAGLSADDVSVNWLPLYHDMGLMSGLVLPLMLGAPGYLISPSTFLARPLTWLEAFSRLRGTAAAAPNFAYDLCCERISDDDLARLDLAAWKVAVTGAEPVRMATIDRFASRFAPAGFRRATLMPSYGLAEATLLVTAGVGGQESLSLSAADLAHGIAVAAQDGLAAKTVVSCGMVQPEQRVVIVDGQGVPCLDRAIGEIWVAGPSIASGYEGNPDATIAAFGGRLPGDERSYLRTGDLGFLDEGRLFVTGRVKDLLIVRGANVYPQDLEATAVESHEAFRSGGAAAFDLEGGDRILIVVEVGRTQEGLAEAGRRACRRAIAATHGLTVEVAPIRQGALPRTTSGKVQRGETRRRWLLGELPILTRPVSPPAGMKAVPETLAALRGICRDALGVSDIGADENFFDLGADSLKLAELHAAAADLAPDELELVELFAHPTLRALAHRICGVSLSDLGRARSFFEHPTIARLAAFPSDTPVAPAAAAGTARAGRRRDDRREGLRRAEARQLSAADQGGGT